MVVVALEDPWRPQVGYAPVHLYPVLAHEGSLKGTGRKTGLSNAREGCD